MQHRRAVPAHRSMCSARAAPAESRPVTPGDCPAPLIGVNSRSVPLRPFVGLRIRIEHLVLWIRWMWRYPASELTESRRPCRSNLEQFHQAITFVRILQIRQYGPIDMHCRANRRSVGAQNRNPEFRRAHGKPGHVKQSGSKDLAEVWILL